MSEGSGPKVYQSANVAVASIRTTGTKTPATRSTSRWIEGFEAWASRTSAVIRASTASRPTRSVRTRSRPERLIVPPMTPSPGPFSTGMLSPVTIDSSTALRPDSTAPSTGIRSPGRTTARSPGTTSSARISTSSPSRRIRAVRGARSMSARSAFDVVPRARASSAWPRTTRVMTTAAASKNGWAAPAGKSPGAARTATE